MEDVALRDFRELKVWRKSHELVLHVYRHTQTFPAAERYGLTSQLRRSAASIPANIAEGCGRGGDVEFKRFLQIAFGSANETEYHLILAKDLGFLNENAFQELVHKIQEVKRMASSLILRLRSGRSDFEAKSTSE